MAKLKATPPTIYTQYDKEKDIIICKFCNKFTSLNFSEFSQIIEAIEAFKQVHIHCIQREPPNN